MADDIVRAADLTSATTLVEIGPGRGALTRRLVDRVSSLVLVELDPALVTALDEKFGDEQGVRVVEADARHWDPAHVLPESAVDYTVVGSLPYYAASPIIRALLESSRPPKLAVVMVQREVAQEMTATPGDMGLLSVATQLYAKATIVRHVPPKAFRPPPKVHSSVLKLEVRDRLATELDSIPGFFRLVRAGFSAPRKTLPNSLAIGLHHPAAVFTQLTRQAGLDPGARPAALSVEDWGRLYRAWRDSAPAMTCFMEDSASADLDDGYQAQPGQRTTCVTPQSTSGGGSDSGERGRAGG